MRSVISGNMGANARQKRISTVYSVSKASCLSELCVSDQKVERLLRIYQLFSASTKLPEDCMRQGVLRGSRSAASSWPRCIDLACSPDQYEIALARCQCSHRE